LPSCSARYWCLFAGDLVGERESEAGTKHRLGAQYLFQVGDRKFIGIEILRIRPEPDGRARPRLRRLSHNLELRLGLAGREADVVFLAAAAHPAFEILRERVHDRYADAVQAARVLVVLIAELAAGVQPREDHLDAADFLLGMNVDGHPAPVILDLAGPVLV
jgi:hypothetical protein